MPFLQQDFSDGKPIAWSHFTAEGDVEFKAVLFVPPKAPMICMKATIMQINQLLSYTSDDSSSCPSI